MPDDLKARELSAAERLDWPRLIRSQNAGPITFYELLRHFESAGDALDAIPELSRRGGRKRPLKVQPRSEAERELEKTYALGGSIVAAIEPNYPRALAHIPDAPPIITVRGHVHLLEKHTVGIVGARNASANGVRFARDLAAALGQEEFFCVRSRPGIDTAAHQGALSSGTVAVMAGGIEVVYPAENETLYEEIIERGVVFSEMPLGTTPQARHFPRRNRLVSGISKGIVIVEAAPRSGSLITARLAAEQGREVFAVPGSPLDPRYRGTNNLIRNGVTICENADDVVQGLRSILDRPMAEPEFEFDGPPLRPPTEEETSQGRALIHEKLGPTLVPVDELIRQSGLSPAAVLTIPLELELAGRLRREPGNQVCLIE